MGKLTTVLDVASFGCSCNIWKTPRFIKNRFYIEIFSDSATEIYVVFYSSICKYWLDFRYISPRLTFLVIPRDMLFPKITETTLRTLALSICNNTMRLVCHNPNSISLRTYPFSSAHACVYMCSICVLSLECKLTKYIAPIDYDVINCHPSSLIHFSINQYLILAVREMC